MAVLLLCSVYDTKVSAFSPPFVCKSRGESIRSFSDACGDDSLPFKKHPADYVLHFIGEFDDQTGRLMIIPNPERLISGDEIG